MFQSPEGSMLDFRLATSPAAFAAPKKPLDMSQYLERSTVDFHLRNEDRCSLGGNKRFNPSKGQRSISTQSSRRRLDPDRRHVSIPRRVKDRFPQVVHVMSNTLSVGLSQFPEGSRIDFNLEYRHFRKSIEPDVSIPRRGSVRFPPTALRSRQASRLWCLNPPRGQRSISTPDTQ